MISRRAFLRGAGGAVALAGGTAVYAFAVEPILRLTVKEYSIAARTWPAGAPPLRIAALSDFHVAKPWMTAGRIKSIAKAAMRQRPDMIVLLGDYLTGVSEDWRWGVPTVEEWMASLGRLSAPLGVFAILGNHDTVPEPIRNGFAAINIPLLENAAVKIGCNNYDFWIAGVGDRAVGNEDLKATLAAVTDDRPIIMLAHEPDSFPDIAAAERQVLLTLSGHTHGGQVALPYLTAAYAGDREHYLYGHFSERDRHLVVSAGLGVTRYPVRFLRPPEITIVTVTSAPSA